MRRTYVTLFAIASLGALLGLTVILGSILGREMTLRMDELKSKSIQALESFLGSKVTYSSISPSFLNYLEIRDLVIHDATEPEKPILTIHRVRIYYSLAHLLARRDPVGALREIRILNSRFSLDLQEDKAAVDLIQKLTTQGASDTGLRARITGEDVNLALRSQGTTVTISHLFFGLNAEKSALAASFRGECSATLPSGFSFSSELNVSGKIDRTFTWSDLTVRLVSFDSSLLHVERQTLQVVWKGSQVQIQKIEDRSPIELGITADLDKKQLTINFQTDGLRADRLVRFSSSMARFNNLLKAPVTAAGRLTYSIPTNQLAYEVGISAWFEDQLPVHDLTLQSTFVGTEKGASFSPLRLSSPNGSLQFDGRISYRDFYPEGTLLLTDVDTGTGRLMSAELTVQRQDGGLGIEGRHLRFGDVKFDDVSIVLAPSEQGARFTVDSSFADSTNGSVSAQGELLLRKPIRAALAEADVEPARFPGIVMTASLRDAPPDKLYDLLVGPGPVSKQQEDLRSMLTRYTVTADMQLTTDFSTVSVKSQGVTVTQLDDPATAIHFSVALDSSHVSIED
ncbi:MAG TPA: hypothetical protein VL354_19600, partial [Spirochaetia bacterium]|nr:hypothetical protein [Spirochaetia bacterium]